MSNERIIIVPIRIYERKFFPEDLVEQFWESATEMVAKSGSADPTLALISDQLVRISNMASSDSYKSVLYVDALINAMWHQTQDDPHTLVFVCHGQINADAQVNLNRDDSDGAQEALFMFLEHESPENNFVRYSKISRESNTVRVLPPKETYGTSILPFCSFFGRENQIVH